MIIYSIITYTSTYVQFSKVRRVVLPCARCTVVAVWLTGDAHIRATPFCEHPSSTVPSGWEGTLQTLKYKQNKVSNSAHPGAQKKWLYPSSRHFGGVCFGPLEYRIAGGPGKNYPGLPPAFLFFRLPFVVFEKQLAPLH